jgi:hypothetical protein
VKPNAFANAGHRRRAEPSDTTSHLALGDRSPQHHRGHRQQPRGIQRQHRKEQIGGVPASVWYLASSAALGAIGAAISGSGARLAAERSSGWVRQLRVTPLTEASWLVGRILSSLRVRLARTCGSRQEPSRPSREIGRQLIQWRQGVAAGILASILINGWKRQAWGDFVGSNG